MSGDNTPEADAGAMCESDTDQRTRRQVWIRPSTANLWAHPEGCWASATFEPHVHGEDESEYTLRGTRLHAAVAHLIAPDDRDKPALDAGEWQIAHDAIKELRQHVDVDAFDWRTEQHMSRWMGRYRTARGGEVLMDGTADLIGVPIRRGFGKWKPPRGEPGMIIADWKFGQLPVSAVDNWQLRSYAVMALCSLEDTGSFVPGSWLLDELKIVLLVIQPAAADRFEPVISRLECTLAEVREWARYLDALVDKMALFENRVEYTPSARNCKWCDAAKHGTCPKVFDIPHEMATPTRADAPEIAAGDVPDSLIARTLAQCDVVDVFAKHLRTRAKRTLEAGGSLSGLKLVVGRAGRRKWTDEDAAASALHESNSSGVDIFEPPTLRSPAALEKEFRKHKDSDSVRVIAQHVDRSAPLVIVAPADDPREALGAARDSEALDHFKAKRKEN